MRCEFDEARKELTIYQEEPFNQEVKITDWDQGFDIKVSTDRGWVTPLIPPEIWDPADADYQSTVLKALEQMIPDEVFQVVRRFQFRSLFLLELISKSRPAFQLAKANPNLFWLTACRIIENELTPSQIASLFKGSQTAIIQTLFQQSAKSIPRFLKKLVCDRFTENHYRILKSAILSDDLIDCLKHQQKIPVEFLPTLMKVESIRNPAIISYWVEKSRETQSDLYSEALQFQYGLNRCRLAGRVLRISNIEHHLNRCRTPEQVENLSARWDAKKVLSENYRTAEIKAEQIEKTWVERITTNKFRLLNPVPPDDQQAKHKQGQKTKRKSPRKQTRKQKQSTAAGEQAKTEKVRKKGEFPPPPYKGIDGLIVPVTTKQELAAEAVQQKNCLNSHQYREGIAKGRCYIYRLLKPRVTIELKKIRDHWQLGAMTLACNQMPSKETRKIIKDWFNDSVARENAEKLEKDLIKQGQMKL